MQLIVLALLVVGFVANMAAAVPADVLAEAVSSSSESSTIIVPTPTADPTQTYCVTASPAGTNLNDFQPCDGLTGTKGIGKEDCVNQCFGWFQEKACDGSICQTANTIETSDVEGHCYCTCGEAVRCWYGEDPTADL